MQDKMSTRSKSLSKCTDQRQLLKRMRFLLYAYCFSTCINFINGKMLFKISLLSLEFELSGYSILVHKKKHSESLGTPTCIYFRKMQFFPPIFVMMLNWACIKSIYFFLKIYNNHILKKNCLTVSGNRYKFSCNIQMKEKTQTTANPAKFR